MEKRFFFEFKKNVPGGFELDFRFLRGPAWPPRNLRPGLFILEPIIRQQIEEIFFNWFDGGARKMGGARLSNFLTSLKGH